MPRKSSKKAEAAAPAPSPDPLAAAQNAAGSAPSAIEPVAATDALIKPAAKPRTAAKKTAAKKTAAKKSAAKKSKLPGVKKSTKKAAETPSEAAIEQGTAAPERLETPVMPDLADAEALAHSEAIREETIAPNDVHELQDELLASGLDAEAEAAAAPDSRTTSLEHHEHPAQDFEPEPRPPAKLERLQKILAQAGVASRRHAEELITQGRVQVNGQVVTTLGSKADPARDHIRVDGKLLHGAERLRYFMLNKPRGYVTTVSDPEGRPTVMEFFKKAGERLYPVGRLDYLSEGLLLVTNDGELANKLTRAASGVEKTYLVKVSGQPTEDQIESLREGVRIDRAKPGEGRVQTAPARIHQVRIGENPWYEVVLIEGRNRELRKMFEEIGHFVEKIRRVNYGPLVLDLEPGQVRELDAQELNLLRLAADGKWKPKKIKSIAMLPKEPGRTVGPEAVKKGAKRPASPATGLRRGGDRPLRQNRPERPVEGREDRRPPGRPQNRGFAPRREDGGFAPREDRRGGRGPRSEAGRGFGRPAPDGDRSSFPKPPTDRGEGRAFTRPPAERGGERRGFSRPQGDGTGQVPFRGRPAGSRFDRPAFPARPRRPEEAGGFEERRPFRPRGEPPAGAEGEKPGFGARPAKPTGRGFGDRRRGAQGAGRSFGKGSDGGGTGRPAGRTGAPPRREAGTSSGTRPPSGFVGRPGRGSSGRTGFQGRGPGGGARPGGSRPAGPPRQGPNGARGFKGKPGGRPPNHGPNRGGGPGRKRG
jgi:23S rRNA pseudouridine2605 synthase